MTIDFKKCRKEFRQKFDPITFLDAVWCYKTYLAMKQHFTKDKYDYHKYCGRIVTTPAAFNKRKDRYFFERMSRQKNDREIEDFFVANFVSCDDPQRLWIGDIIREE